MSARVCGKLPKGYFKNMYFSMTKIVEDAINCHFDMNWWQFLYCVQAGIREYQKQAQAQKIECCFPVSPIRLSTNSLPNI